MAKAVTYFSVKGGLNTEANPLNMPPEDCVDILNCNLNLDGSIQRRDGVDFVKANGGDKTASGFTTGLHQNTYTFTTDSYITISGTDYNKFLLVKSGIEINIFTYVSVVDLETATPFQTILLQDGDHKNYKTTFASFGDNVVLINEAMPLVYLKILGNAFVIERDGIYIRDFGERVPTVDSVVAFDGYAYKCIRNHFSEDSRTTPGHGTDWRKYWVLLGPKVSETEWVAANAAAFQYVYLPYLFYKAYFRARQASTNQSPVVSPNPTNTVYWEYVGLNKLPSGGTDLGLWNSATSYLGPSAVTMPSTYVSVPKVYNGITFYEEYFSTAPSATSEPGVSQDWQDYWEYLGVYVSTVFPAWTANSGVSPTDYKYKSSVRESHETQATKSGYTIGCFASGRLWLVGNSNTRNAVYVSQSITSGIEFNRMYQFADPYSKTDSTIVDTDGAVVVVSEAANILHIIPYNFGVLVFAENGVWYIGGQDGFKTTAISIQKISDVGVLGQGSVTSVESGVVFFGNNSVYGIKESISGSGYPESQDIGTKIQTAYTSIPNAARVSAEAVFDKLNKRLYYFYHSGTAKTYNRCLVLDTRTGSWFKHSIDSASSAVISHFVATPNTSTESEFIFVIQAADSYWGFGRFTSGVWSDFAGTAAEKKTYESYITMAHQTYGTVIRKREATYLTTVFERLEPTYDGSCKMRVDWNWARSSASPYFGTARQVYFPNKYITSHYTDTLNGLETVVSKHKIRGWGNVFRFHFESEGDMPFKLLGWELLVEVDRTP